LPRAGLKERYVREWLGAMVTGRIIEYDPATRRYWLPREHAASLTRAAGPDNLAALSQIADRRDARPGRERPLVPGLVGRLEAGIDVLDLGCGEGVAVRMMAQRFPRSRFTGVDIAAEAIAAARAEAEAARLTNARFLAQDAATFSAPSGLDFATAFDAIHDQAAPRRVLRAIHEALRPGGVFRDGGYRAVDSP
jgi:SAM-dependent methyltransferase